MSGLARGTLCYVRVTIPEGEGEIWGKRARQGYYTPNNCELDWSVQQHMTGADA